MASIQAELVMRNQFDFVGYNADHQVVLIAEVKSTDVSEDGATFFRRNLLSHELLTEKPYFLLVYFRNLYLWSPDAGPNEKPNYNASATPIFEKYLGKDVGVAGRPGPESLELAVKMWLLEFTRGTDRKLLTTDADNAVIRSGLYDKLLRGEIRREFLA